MVSKLERILREEGVDALEAAVSPELRALVRQRRIALRADSTCLFQVLYNGCNGDPELEKLRAARRDPWLRRLGAVAHPAGIERLGFLAGGARAWATGGGRTTLADVEAGSAVALLEGTVDGAGAVETLVAVRRPGDVALHDGSGALLRTFRVDATVALLAGPGLWVADAKAEVVLRSAETGEPLERRAFENEVKALAPAEGGVVVTTTGWSRDDTPYSGDPWVSWTCQTLWVPGAEPATAGYVPPNVEVWGGGCTRWRLHLPGRSVEVTPDDAWYAGLAPVPVALHGRRFAIGREDTLLLYALEVPA